MKEKKKTIVNESIGSLAAELETQELSEVNGGAGLSVATAITALTEKITARMSDKRNCGAYWTISNECWFWAC